jgi:hypothetical protein
MPALAESAADYGLKRLLHGDARWGLYWYEVACGLQPREAQYYWSIGTILRDQAENSRNRGLIEKSDASFARGIEVNPFEVNNLLQRSALHRKYGNLLAHPASHAQMMAWIMRARQLQPYSDVVQVEYVRVLEFTSRHQMAVEEAEAFMKKRPDSRTAKKLLEEVGSGKT